MNTQDHRAYHMAKFNEVMDSMAVPDEHREATMQDMARALANALWNGSTVSLRELRLICEGYETAHLPRSEMSR